MKRAFPWYVALAIAMLFACSLFGFGQSAGFDLLQTASGSQVDLSSVSSPSCGSWPNLGSVSLNGRTLALHNLYSWLPWLRPAHRGRPSTQQAFSAERK